MRLRASLPLTVLLAAAPFLMSCKRSPVAVDGGSTDATAIVGPSADASTDGMAPDAESSDRRHATTESNEAGAATSEGDVVTARIDTARTGVQRGAALTLPLRRSWSVRLPGTVTSPVVAGGKVFVVLGGGIARLVALDARTGKTLWGPKPIAGEADENAFEAGYENGRVFTNGGTWATSFDAETGTKKWQIGLGSHSSGAPVALDGRVFIPEEERMRAVTADRGRPLWEEGRRCCTQSATVTSNAAYYVSYCKLPAHEPKTGELLWKDGDQVLPCFWPSPHVTVVGSSIRAWPSRAVVDAKTGKFTDRGPPVDVAKAKSAWRFIPAFTEESMYMADSEAISNVAYGAATPAWSTPLTGVATSPVLVHDHVVVATTKRVVVLDAKSGALAWCSDPLDLPAKGSGGLVVGHRMVLVHRQTMLVAYASGGDGAAPDLASCNDAH